MKNEVTLIGVLEREFLYNHTKYGVKFYQSRIITTRLSGTCDYVPLILPERLYKADFNYNKDFIMVKGQFRSHTYLGSDGKRHLSLHVLVSQIEKHRCVMNEDTNTIELEAIVVKTPIYRVTPAGREITDMIVAVNRDHQSNSDYFPVIVWGKQAIYARDNLNVASQITLTGRIQSRQYLKKSEDGKESTVKTVYEISIANFEELKY